jgi:hypothetical protein
VLSTELGRGSGRLEEAVITRKAMLVKNVGVELKGSRLIRKVESRLMF